LTELKVGKDSDPHWEGDRSESLVKFLSAAPDESWKTDVTVFAPRLQIFPFI